MSSLISKRSNFFSTNELTVSSSYPELALKIKPMAKHLDIAELLVDSVLHPLRLGFGVCIIDSWIRSKELNHKVGGSEDSDHLYGNAVDPRFLYVDDPMKIFKHIFDMNMPIRQCILYLYKKPKPQLHISINIPGREYKNDFLISREPGKYESYN
jgi:hypothetical protein|tara:strand:+ start:2123 stop:2587 length:465 start_codon:yes stop_codon:yes gene_type:complete